MIKFLTASAVAAALLLGAAGARAEESSAIAVADYTVFVDPPTGFVFVKLPAGWRFAGKVGEAELARLPGTVVTALLKSDEAPLVAAREGAAPLKR